MKEGLNRDLLLYVFTLRYNTFVFGAKKGNRKLASHITQKMDLGLCCQMADKHSTSDLSKWHWLKVHFSALP